MTNNDPSTAAFVRKARPVRLCSGGGGGAPACDEAAGPGTGWAGSRDWTDGALALAVPPPWRQLPMHLVPPWGQGPADEDDDDLSEDETGGRPTRGCDLTPVRPAARHYVRALIEVLTGDRALAQLARATTPAVYAQLEATGRLCGARSWAGTVRSVHVSEPADGVAEVAAVVQRHARCHAVAIRLEGRDGRWVMTRVRLG